MFYLNLGLFVKVFFYRTADKKFDILKPIVIVPFYFEEITV